VAEAVLNRIDKQSIQIHCIGRHGAIMATVCVVRRFVILDLRTFLFELRLGCNVIVGEFGQYGSSDSPAR